MDTHTHTYIFQCSTITYKIINIVALRSLPAIIATQLCTIIYDINRKKFMDKNEIFLWIFLNIDIIYDNRLFHKTLPFYQKLSKI